MVTVFISQYLPTNPDKTATVTIGHRIHFTIPPEPHRQAATVTIGHRIHFPKTCRPTQTTQQR
jgi:hypothetical protein